MKKEKSNYFVIKNYVVLILLGLLVSAKGSSQVNILQGFAGTGLDYPFEGEGYGGLSIDKPYGVTFDCAGNVYISQQEISTILKVDGAGVLSHLSGTYISSAGEPWPGTAPSGFDYTPYGWPSTTPSVIPCWDACTGTGYAGDGGLAEPGAQYGLPSGIVYEPIYDRLYIADPRNNRIRVIEFVSSAAPTLRTFYNPSGGPAQLRINIPVGEDPTYGPVEPDVPYGCGQVTVGTGMAVDAAGWLYISDRGNNRVIKLPPTYAAGPPTVVAGISRIAGYTGDGGPALTAKLWDPTGVAVDDAGNVYIADYTNNAIRRVDAVTGLIRTIGGGNLIMGFADGYAPATQFAHPISVAVDEAGRVYVADLRNNRIRVIHNEYVCTVAGDGTTCTSCPYDALVSDPGFNAYQPLGDGADATLGQLFLPSDVKVDKWGNLFIVDMNHNRVRYVCHPQSSCTAAAEPSVTITSPMDGEATCGMPKTFTATTLFVGCNYTYQWQVNGVDAGSPGPTYTYVPADGDVVTCIVTPQPNPYHPSPYFGPPACPTPATIVSNAITVFIDPIPIAGPSTLCVGSTITLSETTTGTWSISGGGSAHARLGTTTAWTTEVIGITAGTETVTFTSTGGCIATHMVTVGPMPIVGPGSVCIGSTITLSDASPGGTWSSGTPAMAIVDPVTGVVTGISSGLVGISYTLPDGCSTMVPIMVYLIPDPIVGSDYVCIGSSDIYTDGMPGGVWSISPTTVASISDLGISGSLALASVGGISTGTATITYMIAATGCFVTKDISVANPPPIVNLVTPTDDPSIAPYDYGFELSDAPCDGNYIIIYRAYYNNFHDGFAVDCNELKSQTVSTSGGVGFFGLRYAFFDMLNMSLYMAYPPYTSYPSSSLSTCLTYATWVGGTNTDPSGTWGWLGIYKIDLISVASVECGCQWDISGERGRRPAHGNTKPIAILDNLSINPNPNTGSFTIKGLLPSVKTSKEANIEVTDLLGKTVYTDVAAIENGGVSKEVKLDSDVPNGIYLVRIKNGEVNEVIKFTLDR